MATITSPDAVTGDTATSGASDIDAVPHPRDPHVPVRMSRSSCCRCRETIVQGVLRGADETWVTATEGDPWCQGGAHLPKAVHLDGW
jgi:hypothetical protein